MKILGAGKIFDMASKGEAPDFAASRGEALCGRMFADTLAIPDPEPLFRSQTSDLLLDFPMKCAQGPVQGLESRVQVRRHPQLGVRGPGRRCAPPPLLSGRLRRPDSLSFETARVHCTAFLLDDKSFRGKY